MIHLAVRVPLSYALLVLFAAVGTTCAHAFDDLSDAQNLIYDLPHLANVDAGRVIRYSYESRGVDQDSITDMTTLLVKKVHQDERRDVTIEFLSGERHMFLPPFDAYRGNPVIIAMLEHVAKSMGNATGGGTLYFRNRFRDGLASDAVNIKHKKDRYQDQDIKTTELSFTPLANDTYLANRPEYTSARFTITLSDDVPGGVLGIRVESEPKGTPAFFKNLELE